tara:strand:+ start:757 stop:1158 length:402 start_codon:yes stop_codon:yes gene_type:complete
MLRIEVICFFILFSISGCYESKSGNKCDISLTVNEKFKTVLVNKNDELNFCIDKEIGQFDIVELYVNDNIFQLKKSKEELKIRLDSNLISDSNEKFQGFRSRDTLVLTLGNLIDEDDKQVATNVVFACKLVIE